MTKALAADAGVPGSLLETPWVPRAEDRIGLYGCSGDGGRLVRVGLRGEEGRKPPRALEVDCPACGVTHLARPAWRKPAELDEGRVPDVVVDLADLADDDEPPAGLEDED